MTHRSQVITGNWKMYKTQTEATYFVRSLMPRVESISTQVCLAVPFTMICGLAEEAKESRLVIGAQNMNDVSEGAFTGEIAAKMLIEAGAQFVLLGHSERRCLFQENNDFINRKVKRAVKEGLRPVLCIGESKEERQADRTEEVIRSQLTECLIGLMPDQLKNLIVAYEPVWAIGAGEAATPEMAQKAHYFCRQILGELLTIELANQIVIQYGGSVNASNAKELMNQPDIDGLLIGGASLSLESFSQIVDDSESILNLKVESI